MWLQYNENKTQRGQKHNYLTMINDAPLGLLSNKYVKKFLSLSEPWFSNSGNSDCNI